MGKNNNKSRKGSLQALSVPYSFPTNWGGVGWSGWEGTPRKSCPLEVKQEWGNQRGAEGVSGPGGSCANNDKATFPTRDMVGHSGCRHPPEPPGIPSTGLATCLMPQPGVSWQPNMYHTTVSVKGLLRTPLHMRYLTQPGPDSLPASKPKATPVSPTSQKGKQALNV